MLHYKYIYFHSRLLEIAVNSEKSNYVMVCDLLLWTFHDIASLSFRQSWLNNNLISSLPSSLFENTTRLQFLWEVPYSVFLEVIYNSYAIIPIFTINVCEKSSIAFKLRLPYTINLNIWSCSWLDGNQLTSLNGKLFANANKLINV